MSRHNASTEAYVRQLYANNDTSNLLPAPECEHFYGEEDYQCPQSERNTATGYRSIPQSADTGRSTSSSGQGLSSMNEDSYHGDEDNTTESVRQLKKNNDSTHHYSSPPDTSHNDDGAGTIQSTDKTGLVLMSIFTMLFISGVVLVTTFMNQYLFQYFSRRVLGNLSVDTSKNPCENTTTSQNTSDKELVEKVHDMTAQLQMYLELVTYGLGMFTNVILGIYSQVMSRKVLLLIPMMGYLGKAITMLVVAFWDLDANWFFLGYGLEGITGNICGLFLGIFLYTSDITPRDRRRTMGVAIVEGVKGIVEAGCNILAGLLIEKTGFLPLAVITVGMLMLATALIFFLPDRKPVVVTKQSLQPWTLKGSLTKMAYPYFFHPLTTVKRLITLGTVSFFLIYMTKYGVNKIRTLFLMNFPFCFDAITVGWFFFGRDLSYNFFSIVAVVILYRKLPGLLLGIVGTISLTGGYLVYALAETKTEIFFAPFVAVGQLLPSITLRGEMSRVLEAESQGPLFASLAVMESISFAISPPIFNYLYQISLTSYRGLPWLAAASVTTFVLLPMGLFQYKWRQYYRIATTQTLNIQS